jgi:hypothetical protein
LFAEPHFDFLTFDRSSPTSASLLQGSLGVPPIATVAISAGACVYGGAVTPAMLGPAVERLTASVDVA